ncbi:MAG: dienelactone hydrolase family protein [Proteobacteria bacterium]|nr:dienelactone hydrolase family protein [Pseudomonadota bacterium]
MLEGILKLDGPRFGPVSGEKAEQLVILLHGVGADGQDLIGLAPFLAQSMPDAAFVSPNAPFPCDMAPYGYQWFSLQDRSASSILAGVQATAPILNAFIDSELAAHGLTSEKLALIGFSQGTMMSLYIGPRREEAAAGVVGFSGRLVGPDLLENDIRSRPPMLLIHGDADPVVPFESLGLAEEGLQSVGIQVDTVVRPGLGHGIDEEGMARAAVFLKGCFGL